MTSLQFNLRALRMGPQAYSGDDPRLEGLSVECTDPIPDTWSRYTLRERNGMVLADGLTAQQVELLLNRMKTTQVLP